jgi:hypothetical protein
MLANNFPQHQVRIQILFYYYSCFFTVWDQGLIFGTGIWNRKNKALSQWNMLQILNLVEANLLVIKTFAILCFFWKGTGTVRHKNRPALQQLTPPRSMINGLEPFRFALYSPRFLREKNSAVSMTSLKPFLATFEANISTYTKPYAEQFYAVNEGPRWGWLIKKKNPRVENLVRVSL